MNGLAFGGTIQPFLEIRKMLGRLIFLSGLNQGNDLLLGIAGCLQENTVDLTAAERGTGLFGGRSCVGHKRKECLRHRSPVNP